MNSKSILNQFLNSFSYTIIPYILILILYRTKFKFSLLTMLTSPISGDWGDPSIIRDALPSLIRTLAELMAILVFSLLLLIIVIKIYLLFSNHTPVIFQGNWLLIMVSSGIILFLLYLQQNFGINYFRNGYEQQFYIGTSYYFVFVVINSLLFISRVLYELSRIKIAKEVIVTDNPDRMSYPKPNSKLIQKNKEYSNFRDNRWYLLLSATKSALPHLFGYYIFTSYVLLVPNLVRSFYIRLNDWGWQFLFIFMFLFLFSIVHFILSLALLKLNSNNDTKSKLYYKHSTTRTIFGNTGIIFYLLMLVFGIMLYINRMDMQFSGGFLFFHSPDTLYQRSLGVMQHGFVLGTDFQGRDLFANLTLSMFDLFRAILIGLTIRTIITILYLSKGSKSQLITMIMEWMASIPKFPVLFLLALFAHYNHSATLFYVLSALIFTPNSLESTISTTHDFRTSSFREQFRMIRTVVYHIILSITIELILMALVLSTFNTDIRSISDIIQNQAVLLPTQQFLQSAIVFLFPFILVLPWYFKHDSALK